MVCTEEAINRTEDTLRLLEGRFRSMHDLNCGICPFVTWPNPIAGAGSLLTAITSVTGGVKARRSATGVDPLPIDPLDGVGARMREVGQQSSATTDRPRRCDWLVGGSFAPLPSVPVAWKTLGAEGQRSLVGCLLRSEYELDH